MRACDRRGVPCGKGFSAQLKLQPQPPSPWPLTMLSPHGRRSQTHVCRVCQCQCQCQSQSQCCYCHYYCCRCYCHYYSRRWTPWSCHHPHQHWVSGAFSCCSSVVSERPCAVSVSFWHFWPPAWRRPRPRAFAETQGEVRGGAAVLRGREVVPRAVARLRTSRLSGR